MTEDMRERDSHVEAIMNLIAMVRCDSSAPVNREWIARRFDEYMQAALSSAGASGTPSAPDRAEELARKIDAIWQLQLGDDYWPSDARNEAVASLLREAMGRCPTCGLTIVPRLCANPACASSVRR